METKYFYPKDGKLFFTSKPDLKLKNKIDNLCTFSLWQTELLKENEEIEYFPKHHGYILDNKCYNNEEFFSRKSWEKYYKDVELRKEKLNNFVIDTNKCINLLESLFKRIKDYRNCKASLKKLSDTFEKKYVINETILRGSKKRRRFYKGGSYRYLTEKELKNMEVKIKELKEERPKIKNLIKSPETIEKVFSIVKDVSEHKKLGEKLNFMFTDYGNTIFLYKIFEEEINKINKDLLL